MSPEDDGDTVSPAAMSVTEGLQKYGDLLTPYEKEEITAYTKVYYCGQGCDDKIKAPTSGPNQGYDTSDGEYIFRPHDHIAYRYEILEELGSGAFGQVMKAIDHFDNQVVALKLIRNQRKVLQQAVQEINILEHVNNRDPKNLYGIVRMIENFSFRGHTCISYELLGTNLYEYLKEKDFYPMPLSTVRGIAARMLVALTFLSRENIMHCDLKPENILIRGSDPSVVKLCDLGSASFDASNSFMYIQSRFYRAPEVILEQKYSKSIDWWSFGCILCELANGDPVFPGDDEKDQLSCIMEYLGSPPQGFIEASSARRKREFFDEHLQPRPRQTKKGRERVPASKSLAKFLGVEEDDDFLSFVMQFLQWDPAARVTPREAMRHKWISDEFVFPTRTEEAQPSASPSNAESSSAAVAAPEASEAKKAATSTKASHGAAAWSSRHSAVVGPVVAATTWSDAPGQAESTTRRTRNGQHSAGTASVPPVADSREETPRATALSTGGAPRRPPVSQRHGGQPYRGRQRRSTEMADVEMPGEASRSVSVTLTGAAPEEKARDFLMAADGGAGHENGAASGESPRSRAKPTAPPALKESVLSPVVLSLSGAPPTAATSLQGRHQSAPKRGAHGVAPTSAGHEDDREVAAATRSAAAYVTPRGSKCDNTDTPTSAERRSRVLDLRRKYEAGAGPTSGLDAVGHLEDSTRSAGPNVLRFANVAGFGSHDKDPRNDSLSYSAKQRQGVEPVPTTPPRAAKGKSASERRREYSITLEGTPSPPALEGLQPTERPRAHLRGSAMPPELGGDKIDRAVSMLSASRPHEPGSSFMFGGRHPTHGAAEQMVNSSGETAMLSSPPSRPPATTSFAAAVPAPQTRDAALPPRRASDGRGQLDQGKAAASEAARGRHPPVGNLLRLAQRQRTSLVGGLGGEGGKAAAPPPTVFPPLKKSFVPRP